MLTSHNVHTDAIFFFFYSSPTKSGGRGETINGLQHFSMYGDPAFLTINSVLIFQQDVFKLFCYAKRFTTTCVYCCH